MAGVQAVTLVMVTIIRMVILAILMVIVTTVQGLDLGQGMVATTTTPTTAGPDQEQQAGSTGFQANWIC